MASAKSVGTFPLPVGVEVGEVVGVVAVVSVAEVPGVVVGPVVGSVVVLLVAVVEVEAASVRAFLTMVTAVQVPASELKETLSADAGGQMEKYNR
jgi:hypothetical protein